ncbi:tRNA synthetases class I (C) catalytic domain-containing protein [Schizophyllum commune]
MIRLTSVVSRHISHVQRGPRIRLCATMTALPTWTPPTRKTDEPVLKVYNTLTKAKNEFIPSNGRLVKWYNCGPTVYDASHMGHARNYVSQDILRRIMSDYFGYDVHFVMNITDIDNKIIDRARKTHLLETFLKESTQLTPELIAQTEDAWRLYIRTKVAKGLPESERPAEGQEDATWKRISESITDPAWKAEALKRSEPFDMHATAARRGLAAIVLAKTQLAQGVTSQEAAHELINVANEVLEELLDQKYKSTITDPSLSRNLAAYWEGRFFEDMARLRVRRPDTVTRVTEYVPEIVSFVQKVIDNGYAYESAGSVYFDTQAFDAAPNHFYAKLEPYSKGNREDDGGSRAAGQRSASDFALWKASKPGEPYWESPWGHGRPGWHIECSVMASAILGDNMDIHSGGVDLAFPHHDNEMAQSETYHDCSAWVNYFLHTGHLHIEGLKMSKSLKNFITIDEILERFTARQLRLSFLSQLWNAKLDFSEALMQGEVRGIEAQFNNFFTLVKALISDAKASGQKSDGYHHYEAQEAELTKALYDAQAAFRAALCDSFNTPVALNVLRDLVSRTNVYVNSRGKLVNLAVVEQVARWVGKMLRMFGLGEGEVDEIGWGQDSQGAGAVNKEEVLMPYLRAMSAFRDAVRKVAIEKSPSALKDILALSDRLRDVDLVPLGVALDDQEDGKALVKLVPAEELIAAREAKRAAAEAKAAKKAAAQAAEEQKRIQKLEKGRLPPSELFRPPQVPEGTYSQWAENGLPTHDGEGKELSKNQVKKVQKEWAAQEKLHQAFLQWQKEKGGQ